MPDVRADVVVIGSGAGGGTVAQRLAPLAESGRRVIVLEQGARLRDEEFNGDELDMAPALYADGGGFLTAEGTMTLAFGQAYGGSTVVYTGTSLPPPERVIRDWAVPGLDHDDLIGRTVRYVSENGVHLYPDEEINENNRLFVRGAERAGFEANQFPVNTRGCKGASLCNLGCPNGAKQGTHKVQLPNAEAMGVEVVTRAEVVRLEERLVHARVGADREGALGGPSEWKPGEYRIQADTVVVAGGSIGTSALLLRSGFGASLPRLGEGFTCHPAFILVGEHAEPIGNDVGHPKSFYVDRAVEEGFILETCMYFPFVTAKNLTGFGPDHERLMRAFPRLQMILVLGCDKRADGNRITVDRAGRPVVHYRFTEPVVSSMVAATRAAAKIFFAAGAERVHAPPADPPLIERRDEDRIDELIGVRHFVPGRLSISAAHLMGGCGMGTDATDSVTDAWGRVHGVPWLRVADSSLFPDSIEINPYLTIMSLADRVADGLLEDTR
jgi:choline dehydrogenase-like flavoprotein